MYGIVTTRSVARWLTLNLFTLYSKRVPYYSCTCLIWVLYFISIFLDRCLGFEPFDWNAKIWEPFKMKLIWGLRSSPLPPTIAYSALIATPQSHQAHKPLGDEGDFSSAGTTIWANQPIHSSLVGCLNPYLLPPYNTYLFFTLVLGVLPLDLH